MHKPSDAERYWFRNTLLVAGAALSVKTVVGLWRDGTLAALLSFVKGKLHDHVLEPLEKLAGELFDTIRKRDFVVTREECEESKAALDRMLRDFSQSTSGSTLIADMKGRIQETLREQQEAAAAIAGKFSGGGGASGGTKRPSGAGGPGSSTASGSSASGIRPGSSVDRLAAEEFSPEQAMAALMTAYERELQAPVKGLVFGNLMTALLIQMQKLKVHTEAAMLTMGQVDEPCFLFLAEMASPPHPPHRFLVFSDLGIQRAHNRSHSCHACVCFLR